jgi:hypothetical protein
MENELAVLAIKGGRYSEAEQMFNLEITTNPTSMSYYGLGLCKINMLLNIGRTTDEAFYCFQKAIKLSEENDRSKMEVDIIAICVNNLMQFQSLYTQLEQEKKKQTNKAILGTALAVGSAMIGSSGSSNAFTQISSLAVAGTGVGISLDGLSQLGTIPVVQQKILELSTDIKSQLKKIISNETMLLNDSLASIPDISTVIIEIGDENKWYNKEYSFFDPRKSLALYVKYSMGFLKKVGIVK